jgi:hypothetical protein
VEHTGHGFVEWRNRTRLERFHILYPKSGDLLTAALEAGFGSYTQFHRVFSEIVGATPGDWAKSGARPKSVALPSASNTISGSDTESTRMVTYSLSEIALPNTSRWFTPAFGANLDRSRTVGQRAERIESGISDYSDLAGLDAQLEAEMARFAVR